MVCSFNDISRSIVHAVCLISAWGCWLALAKTAGCFAEEGGTRKQVPSGLSRLLRTRAICPSLFIFFLGFHRLQFFLRCFVLHLNITGHHGIREHAIAECTFS